MPKNKTQVLFDSDGFRVIYHSAGNHHYAIWQGDEFVCWADTQGRAIQLWQLLVADHRIDRNRMDKMRDEVSQPIVKMYEIGPYVVAEYYPTIFKGGAGTGKYDYSKTKFIPFLNDQRLNRCYETLEAALAGAIAYGYEGCNHNADTYFIAALEKLRKPEKL